MSGELCGLPDPPGECQGTDIDIKTSTIQHSGCLFFILILYTLPTLTAPFIRLQSPGCYTAPQGCC